MYPSVLVGPFLLVRLRLLLLLPTANFVGRVLRRLTLHAHP